VWPHLVVFPTPSSDQNLFLYVRVEDLSVQELIAKLADEGLDIVLLPRAARRDEERCHAEGPDRPPILRALEDEFVRPDVISALSPTANSSTATPFGLTPKPASPSSISSRAGTTPIAAKEKDKKLLFTGVNMSA
jgi:hypothetical protein